MATKIDYINDAYSRMRISGLTVNPTPSDLVLALRRLESMAYEFEGRNLCTGYNFEESPDPNSPTNVNPRFGECFVTNLAVKLIPDFNKAVPPQLLAQANASLSGAFSISVKERAQEVSYPSRMATGRGNTMRYQEWNRFYDEPSHPPNSCDTKNLFVGDQNDYSENYISYLDLGETIDTYTIEVDNRLSLISDSLNLDQNIISYRVRGQTSTVSGSWQQVKITITTSNNRIETRLINFDVTKPETVGGN